MIYVYIVCTTFGVLYAALSAIFGGHGADGGLHHDGIGFHHGDSLHHGSTDSADSPSPFNPLVIASAITTFGAIGLITRLGFNIPNLTGAFISLGAAGIVGAAIFFGIVKFMYGSQSNTTFSLNDLVGEEAEIITAVPSKGLGEIACVENGIRYNLPARSADGAAISRGETVRIREITGNVVTVTRKLSIDDLDFEASRQEDSKRNKNTN